MQQLSLFGRVDTRYESYLEIEKKLKVLHRKVCRAFIEAGSAGLTADEAGERLRIDKLTVRPRVTELAKAGVLVETGELRRNQSRRRARVYRIVSAQRLEQLRQAPAEEGVNVWMPTKEATA